MTVISPLIKKLTHEFHKRSYASNLNTDYHVDKTRYILSLTLSLKYLNSFCMEQKMGARAPDGTLPGLPIKYDFPLFSGKKEKRDFLVYLHKAYKIFNLEQSCYLDDKARKKIFSDFKLHGTEDLMFFHLTHEQLREWLSYEKNHEKGLSSFSKSSPHPFVLNGTYLLKFSECYGALKIISGKAELFIPGQNVLIDNEKIVSFLQSLIDPATQRLALAIQPVYSSINVHTQPVIESILDDYFHHCWLKDKGSLASLFSPLNTADKLSIASQAVLSKNDSFFRNLLTHNDRYQHLLQEYFSFRNGLRVLNRKKIYTHNQLLHFAVKHNMFNFLVYLTDTADRIDFNVLSSDGESLLGIAVKSGNFNMAYYLLDKKACPINGTSKSALTFIADYKCKDSLTLARKMLIKSYYLLYRSRRMLQEAIIAGIKNNNIEYIALLLAFNNDLFHFSRSDIQNPLALAVRLGHFEIAHQLIEENISATEGDLESALYHLASYQSPLAITLAEKILQEIDPEFLAQDDLFKKCLLKTIYQNNTAYFELLVSYGVTTDFAHLNLVDPFYPFYHALYHAQYKMVLAFNIADIDFNNAEYLAHPLVIAVLNKDIQSATFLLEHGANPNISEHQLPLCLAIKNHDIEMVKLLTSFGADIFQYSHESYPLLQAVSKNSLALVKVLIPDQLSSHALQRIDKQLQKKLLFKTSLFAELILLTHVLTIENQEHTRKEA
ncbi:hypothetical protein EBS02_05545, partial [bacterium]|nr:hypothetical protein [bacterium]